MLLMNNLYFNNSLVILFPSDVVFATSLMKAALKQQQSQIIISDNPLSSPAVASDQQGNSQVVSITEEESVSNDLDDGDMSKLFYKVTASVLYYSDVLNEAISNKLCIAYFQDFSIGGQQLVCCSCSRPTKQMRQNLPMGSNAKRKHGRRFPRHVMDIM